MDHECAVLREVAGLIASNIREIDAVARYGGEEFAIAFPETRIADAVHLADRLRKLVAGHDWTRVVDPLRDVTVSVGLGGGDEASSFEEALGIADARLHEAKMKGRDQVYI